MNIYLYLYTFTHTSTRVLSVILSPSFEAVHDIRRVNPSLHACSEVPNCQYLEDSPLELKGLRLYGSPWTPSKARGGCFSKGLQLPRGEGMRKKWEKVGGSYIDMHSYILKLY